MNTCDAVQLMLAEFRDGDLDSAEAEAVTSHLAVCPECTAELDREQRLRSVLGGPQAPRTCPPELTSSLRGIPTDADSAGSGFRPLARILPIGLTVALAASLVAVVLVRTPPIPRTETARGPVPAVGTEFTQEEITAARRDLAWTLKLTARVIDRAEKETVSDVFGRKLPAAIHGSLRSAASASQGGRG